MSNIHEGVSCDMCSKSNFSGKRYKCLICYDFDQCEACHDEFMSSSLPLSKPINPNHNHLNTHPMQCILTKSDFELFYGPANGLNDYGEQISFTCPYCGKLGFSESTLCDHLSTQHLNNPQNENLPQEVVCPICAALPSGAGGGDPNHLTEDLLHHIHLEHMNNRNLLDVTSENYGSNSVAAAAALRFSRRLNYAQNATSTSNRGTSGIGTRGNTFRFQFGNPSSGSSAGSALSSFMRNAGNGIDPFNPSSSSGASDPIVELLSQLTGVRRAAGSHSANLTLAQLTRERESLQQQSAAVARHHHLFSGSSSNKLGLSGKSGLGFGQSNSTSNSQNSANNQSNSINQQNIQYVNQLLELPNNLLLQPLPPNLRDSRYLLSKYDFTNVEKQDNQTQPQQGATSSSNIQMNTKQSLLINDILLSLIKYQISNGDSDNEEYEEKNNDDLLIQPKEVQV